MTEKDWWDSLVTEWKDGTGWNDATLLAFSDWLEDHKPAECGLILALRWMVAGQRRPKVSLFGQRVTWLRESGKTKKTMRVHSLPPVIYDQFRAQTNWVFHRAQSGRSRLELAIRKLAYAFERTLGPLGLLRPHHIGKVWA